jgi:hypothetical protein
MALRHYGTMVLIIKIECMERGWNYFVLNPVTGTVSYMFINLIVYVRSIFFERVYPVAFHAT